MSEMFKPKQFDSFDKVPEDQKKNFKKEEDGSFVYKEAAQELSDAELMAEIANTVKEQGITSMDALRERAKQVEEEKNRELQAFKSLKENEHSIEEEWDNKSFVLELIKNEREPWFGYLANASVRLRNDEEVVLEAIKKNGRNLAFASPKLQAKKEFVLEAVKRDADALQFASDSIKEEIEKLLKK